MKDFNFWWMILLIVAIGVAGGAYLLLYALALDSEYKLLWSFVLGMADVLVPILIANLYKHINGTLGKITAFILIALQVGLSIYFIWGTPSFSLAIVAFPASQIVMYIGSIIALIVLLIKKSQ